MSVFFHKMKAFVVDLHCMNKNRSDILQNFVFCRIKNGLEWHESEYMLTEFSFPSIEGEAQTS